MAADESDEAQRRSSMPHGAMSRLSMSPVQPRLSMPPVGSGPVPVRSALRRPRSISAASGARGAHAQMLQDLEGMRTQLPNASTLGMQPTAQRQVIGTKSKNPYDKLDAMHGFQLTAHARTIQATWRRKKLFEEVAKGNDPSGLLKRCDSEFTLARTLSMTGPVNRHSSTKSLGSVGSVDHSSWKTADSAKSAWSREDSGRRTDDHAAPGPGAPGGAHPVTIRGGRAAEHATTTRGATAPTRTGLTNAFACSAGGILLTFLSFIGWFDASRIGGGLTVFFGGVLQLINWLLVVIGTLALWREAHPSPTARGSLMMKLELLAEPITTLREKTKLTDDKKFYMVWYGIINSLVLLSFIGMAGQRCTGLASAQVCISVPFGAMGPLCNLLSLLCYAPALFFLHTHFSAPASPSEEDAAAAASQDDDASKVPPRPQMAIAKEAALAQLAHQRTEDAGPGELYPLHTDLVSFDHFGTDISQYMHFMYSWTRYALILFLLNVANIVINLEGGSLEEAGNIFTYHTLGNTAVDGVLAKGGHSYAVIELITCALLTLYLYHTRAEMERIANRIRRGTNRTLTAADFTLMVSGIPSKWSSAQLRARFEKWGEVVHIGLSLDNRQLVIAVRKAKWLRNKHTDALLDLASKLETGSASAVTAARAAAKASHQEYIRNERSIKGLMKKRYSCTGYAFVTFNTSESAKTALREMPQGSFSHAFGGGLRVKKAPEPHDVLWENLQCGRREQFVRNSISNGILLLLCVAGSTILLFTNVLSSSDFFYSNNLVATGFLPAFGMWLGQTLAIVFGHLIVIITTIVFANTLERPHTHGDKERAVMLRLSFFQVVNNVITVTVLAFWPNKYNPHADGKFQTGWYPTGAMLIISALFGDMVVMGIGMDLLRPPELILKYILAPRAKTQARMNELFSIPADITLSFRMQLLNKFIVLGLMYSFAMPILYLFLAGFCWSGQWVDRYNFLRQLRPPPPTHGKQMRYVYEVILPSAILLHAAMAVKFFYDICDNTAGTSYAADADAAAAATASCSAFLEPSAISSAVRGGCAGFVASPGTLQRDATLQARARNVLNLTSGEPLSPPLSLLCVSAANVSSSSSSSPVDARSVCELSRMGITSFCGDTAWSSAKMIVIITSILTALVLASYVRSNIGRHAAASKKDIGMVPTESKRISDRSSTGRASVLLVPATCFGRFLAKFSFRNAYRFIMQREMVTLVDAGDELPADAHVRERPSDAGDADAPVSARSRLDELSMMYIPPLTATLLFSFCKDVQDRSQADYLRQKEEALREPEPQPGLDAPSSRRTFIGGLTSSIQSVRRFSMEGGGLTSSVGGLTSSVRGRFSMTRLPPSAGGPSGKRLTNLAEASTEGTADAEASELLQQRDWTLKSSRHSIQEAEPDDADAEEIMLRLTRAEDVLHGIHRCCSFASVGSVATSEASSAPGSAPAAAGAAGGAVVTEDDEETLVALAEAADRLADAAEAAKRQIEEKRAGLRRSDMCSELMTDAVLKERV